MDLALYQQPTAATDSTSILPMGMAVDASESSMAPGLGAAATALSEDDLQAFETALYGTQ